MHILNSIKYPLALFIFLCCLNYYIRSWKGVLICILYFATGWILAVIVYKLKIIIKKIKYNKNKNNTKGE